MSLKELANEDLKINTSASSPTSIPPDAIYGGDFNINRTGVVPIKDNSVEAPKGKKVCKMQISYSWVVGAAPCPFSSATYTFVAGAGVLSATSEKIKLSSIPPLRKDDEGNCVGSWINIMTAVPLPCSCKMKISEPGQKDVKSV